MSSASDDILAALSPKRRKFVEEYIRDGNATRSAIAAGYAEKTAASAGWRLLKYEEVAHALEVLRAESAEAVGVTSESVMTAIGEIAFDRERHPSVRLKALELAGRAIGMFQKDRINAEDTALAERLERQRARLKAYDDGAGDDD